jgi:hypothetical protein
MSKLHYLPKDPLNPWQMKCGYWLAKEVEYTSNKSAFKALAKSGVRFVCKNCLASVLKEES